MRFSRNLILLTVILFGLHSNARSQSSGVGAGIIIGEPTGFSFKGWLNTQSAIDAGLAWSFVKEGSFHFHADYLYHSFDVFKTTEKVPLYFGVGGRIKTGKNTDARVGVSGVIGIGYYFKDAPVDLFLEVAPIIDLTPSTELQVNAGFGVRYFFN